MYCSYKFRLYPTKEQEVLFQKNFGCTRFIYNHYLSKRVDLWKNQKIKMDYNMCDKDIPSLFLEYPWLKEAESTSLRLSVKALDDAFNKFFDGLKTNKNIGFPKYKSKKNRKSYRTRNISNNLRIEGKMIRLPKIGKVECRVSREVKGRILFATVIQSSSGKYFVTLCCENVEVDEMEKTGLKCGVDLGVKNIAITSDENKYENNKYLVKSEKKLAKLQREFSRKTSGSKRKEKARIKVAKMYEKITNQRNDCIHKATTDLIRKYDVICIETLSIKDMVKDNKFAKNIYDASLYEFRKQLEYKAEWHQKTIIKVDRYFPSSQLCSCCGYVNKNTKDLSVRFWHCAKCGTVHDRDINAAKNILQEGLKYI